MSAMTIHLYLNLFVCLFKRLCALPTLCMYASEESFHFLSLSFFFFWTSRPLFLFVLSFALSFFSSFSLSAHFLHHSHLISYRPTWQVRSQRSYFVLLAKLYTSREIGEVPASSALICRWSEMWSFPVCLCYRSMLREPRVALAREWSNQRPVSQPAAILALGHDGVCVSTPLQICACVRAWLQVCMRLNMCDCTRDHRLLFARFFF